ncbi:MAG: type II secretion system F family protein [Planctomycetaceae bacterium]|nr:type II secretion system F family protein [Planctomycetaceae bacterium]
MATYEYQALTAAGRSMLGTIEADTDLHAREQLQGMNLTVNALSVQASKQLATPIGRSEFLLFNRQLAAIAGAGLPLERSLRELAGDVSSPRVRRLVEQIAADLEGGATIEAAFNKHRQCFPPLYGQILHAGVTTGRLAEMLTSLNRHVEMSGATRRIVWESVTYPLTVLAIAAVVLTAVLYWVTPQFSRSFQSWQGDKALPFYTRTMLTLSEHLGPIWLAIGAVIVLIVAAGLVLRGTRGGRMMIERALLSFPVIGRACRSGMLARMADAMAVLVGAGHTMSDCLRLAGAASGSEIIETEMQDAAAQVERGQDIVQAGRHCTVIPGFFLYSVQLGSRRNDLPDTLYGLAEMYVHQTEAHQSRLQAAMMPMLLLLVGLMVGVCIFAMFAPYIELLQNLGKNF